MGGYIVRAGDTLSGLAAAQPASPWPQMAAMNGLARRPAARRHACSSCPTGAPAPARASGPRRRARRPGRGRPTRRPARLSAGQIAPIAAQHGVSPSLAAAIAWQESGFNNGMVSAANARGVMQVMPGTWDWVQSEPAPRAARTRLGRGQRPRRRAVPARLLQQTGGDAARRSPATTRASARCSRIGMLSTTRQYVANVLALRSRFGG